MELAEARDVVDKLAQGIHPVTGELMAEDSPYVVPRVLQALVAVSQALDIHCPQLRANAAAGLQTDHNPTRPWSESDDVALVTGFERGDEIRALADALGRTRFGVNQRLIKLGKIGAPAYAKSAA